MLLSLFSTLSATDLELYTTYLPPSYIAPDSLVNPPDINPKIRGPEGTTIYLELTNGPDTLRHRGTFDSEGLIRINDIFNPDTGIETQYVPSSKDFMEINGTDLLYSSGVASKGSSNSNVKSVKITNYKGELVSDLSFVDHGDYVTAHWDGQGVSNSQYYFVVETDKGITAKPITFLKNPTDGHIPSWMFDKLSEHNSKQTIDDVVTTPKVSKGSIWDAKFIYTCDSTAIPERQHEETTLYEQIDSNDASFAPTHWLTPLEQVKTLGMHAYDFDGNVLPEANGQIYDSLGTSLGFVTFDADGYAEIRGLPTESNYTVQVAAPTGRTDLRNVENEIYVGKRTTLNDTLVVNPYFGIIPGDKTHKFLLPTNPEEYDASAPDLTMTRILEGQVAGSAVDSDGRVPADWVMGRNMNVYGIDFEQGEGIETFATQIMGGTGFGDTFTEVYTENIPTGQDYNYLIGAPTAGSNWTNDGDTTTTGEKEIYTNRNEHIGNFVTGGVSKSIGSAATIHELFWYLYPYNVVSEESPAGPEGGNIGSNDGPAVRFGLNFKTQKYANEKSTQELSDYRTEVLDFKSENPTNILRIKTLK